MMHCNAATGVPNNGNGHCKKLRKFLRSGFDIGAYVCNRHTDKELETSARKLMPERPVSKLMHAGNESGPAESSCPCSQ